jgi:hypothetical protein
MILVDALDEVVRRPPAGSVRRFPPVAGPQDLRSQGNIAPARRRG